MNYNAWMTFRIIRHIGSAIHLAEEGSSLTKCYYFISQKKKLTVNVMLQATQDELKVAYRRLCMLYHPDKHRDPELKRQAEQLFNLVHEAYEGKRTYDNTTRSPSFYSHTSSWYWVSCVMDMDNMKALSIMDKAFLMIDIVACPCLSSPQWPTGTSYLWYLWQARTRCWRMGGKLNSNCWFGYMFL